MKGLGGVGGFGGSAVVIKQVWRPVRGHSLKDLVIQSMRGLFGGAMGVPESAGGARTIQDGELDGFSVLPWQEHGDTGHLVPDVP